jgi:hypothetical protein
MGDQPKAVGGIPAKYRPLKITDPLLFHLEKDVSEQHDLYREIESASPQVLERLRALADQARERMGDALRGRPTGTASRPPGQLEAR